MIYYTIVAFSIPILIGLVLVYFLIKEMNVKEQEYLNNVYKLNCKHSEKINEIEELFIQKIKFISREQECKGLTNIFKKIDVLQIPVRTTKEMEYNRFWDADYSSNINYETKTLTAIQQKGRFEVSRDFQHSFLENGVSDKYIKDIITKQIAKWLVDNNFYESTFVEERGGRYLYFRFCVVQ